MRLPDKVCLITGAGSGIGRASAVLFAQEGASVAVADIDRCRRGGDRRDDRVGRRASARVRGRCRRPVSTERLAADVVGGLRSHRRPLQQRRDRRRRCAPRDIARAVGARHGGQRAGRLPRCQGRPARDDRCRSGLDRQHVIGDRRDRTGEPRAVRGIEGCGAVADPPDAGRLCARTASGSTLSCRGRSTRRSWTVTWPTVTTTRRPVSRDQEAPADRRARTARGCGFAALYLASDESRFVLGSGLFVDGGVRGSK